MDRQFQYRLSVTIHAGLNDAQLTSRQREQIAATTRRLADSLKRGDRLAARCVDAVDSSVGVIDRHAARCEHGSGSRFAHADGACECKLDHARAATAARQACSAFA